MKTLSIVVLLLLCNLLFGQIKTINDINFNIDANAMYVDGNYEPNYVICSAGEIIDIDNGIDYYCFLENAKDKPTIVSIDSLYLSKYFKFANLEGWILGSHFICQTNSTNELIFTAFTSTGDTSYNRALILSKPPDNTGRITQFEVLRDSIKIRLMAAKIFQDSLLFGAGWIEREGYKCFKLNLLTKEYKEVSIPKGFVQNIKPISNNRLIIYGNRVIHDLPINNPSAVKSKIINYIAQNSITTFWYGRQSQNNIERNYIIGKVDSIIFEKERKAPCMLTLNNYLNKEAEFKFPSYGYKSIEIAYYNTFINKKDTFITPIVYYDSLELYRVIGGFYTNHSYLHLFFHSEEGSIYRELKFPLNGFVMPKRIDWGADSSSFF